MPPVSLLHLLRPLGRVMDMDKPASRKVSTTRLRHGQMVHNHKVGRLMEEAGHRREAHQLTLIPSNLCTYIIRWMYLDSWKIYVAAVSSSSHSVAMAAERQHIVVARVRVAIARAQAKRRVPFHHHVTAIKRGQFKAGREETVTGQNLQWQPLPSPPPRPPYSHLSLRRA